MRIDDGKGREDDKDASDMIGLMMASDPEDVAATIQSLRQNTRVAQAITTGLEHLARLFAQPRSPGVEMAVRALAGVEDEARIRQLAPAYVAQLPTP